MADLITSSQLRAFSGTSQYYRHLPFPNFLYTDGVKWLAEKGECYWLIDAIASYQNQCQKDAMLRDFQLWHLEVNDETGKLTCFRDTDDEAFHQNISYTDIAQYLDPELRLIKLYVERNVLFLPSER